MLWWCNAESAIRAGLDVVVGTCGRVLDVLERKSLKLDKVEHIILDEAGMQPQPIPI